MESTALAIATPIKESWVTIRDTAQAFKMSSMLAVSGLIPNSIKTPEQVMIILMMGEELGLHPMQSIRSIHVINGKPTLSAQLMQAMVMKSGTCPRWDVDVMTDTECTITAQRGQGKPLTVTWTIEQAKRAGLTGKDVWRNYAAAMLNARATSTIARALWPDVVGGYLTPEEAKDLRDEVRGDVVATPAPNPAGLLSKAITYSEAPKEMLKKVIEGEAIDATKRPLEPTELVDDGIPEGLRAIVDAQLMTAIQARDLAETFGVRDTLGLHAHLVEGLPIKRMYGDKRRDLASHLRGLDEVIEHMAQKEAASDTKSADLRDNPPPFEEGDGDMLDQIFP